jgi:hypothetical protein
MGQRFLARTLLTPSLLSGYVTVFIALAVLALSGWSYLTKSEFLHDYLFGPFGVVTALLYAPDFFAVFRRVVTNNPFTYNAFILVGAVLVGVLVFELLEAIRRFKRNTSLIWYEFHTHTPEAREALTETLVRAVVRIVSALAFVFYSIFVVNIVTPFCILLIENGIDRLSTSPLRLLGNGAASVLLLAVSLHVALVLLRLSLLRPRLLSRTIVSE